MKDHYIPQEQFPIRLKDNIFILGNYFFNLFLVKGEKKSLLFETGISAVVDTVIHQLETLGIKPDFIVPSHPHSDHITGLPGLMEAYPDARIAAATGAGEFIEHPKAGPLMIKEDRFMSASLEKFGIRPGRPPLDFIPDLGDPMNVEDRKTLDLGRTDIELIKVEGHSPGNLIAVVNPGKVIFCSDSIGFHFPGRFFFPLFFTGAGPYLSTLEYIQRLEPDVICPAHQGPLKGEKAVRGIQDSIDQTLQTIQMVKDSGLSEETLRQQLFEKGYRDEFTLYTPENIQNCCALIIKRAKESSLLL